MRSLQLLSHEWIMTVERYNQSLEFRYSNECRNLLIQRLHIRICDYIEEIGYAKQIYLDIYFN